MTAYDSMSDGQHISLIVIELCSASLSVLGSSTILFKIIRDRTKNGRMTSYDRIILGLSSCDIVASITWPLTGFLKPRTTGFPWAFGTAAGCQARGFLSQLALSGWWYNCVLSYYFLLTVISQVRRTNFVGNCEYWMHFSALFFPVTAIMGLFCGWYDDEICTIADPLIKWVVTGIPTTFTLFSVIINNIVIYIVVRKSLKSSEHHAASRTSVQKRLRREALTLMVLYVGSFFATVLPSFIKEILLLYTDNDMSKLHPLSVIESIFLPLQGFFNFFIYIKPMYTRFRANNPNKPIFFVLHQALFRPTSPQMTFSSNHHTSFAIAEEDDANPNQALFNADFGTRPVPVPIPVPIPVPVFE